MALFDFIDSLFLRYAVVLWLAMLYFSLVIVFVPEGGPQDALKAVGLAVFALACQGVRGEDTPAAAAGKGETAKAAAKPSERAVRRSTRRTRAAK